MQARLFSCVLGVVLIGIGCNSILGNDAHQLATTGAGGAGTANGGTGGNSATGGIGSGGAAEGGGSGGAVGTGGARTTGSGGTGAAAGSGGASTGGAGGASSCPSGGTKCSDGLCSSNTDAAHCGSSCSVCAGGMTCNSGSCGCSVSGQQNCSGTCIDTNSSLANCGGCGQACASGQTCSNGGCTCGAGFAVGAGAFVTMPAAGGACWHGYAYNYTDSSVGTTTTITPSTYAGCGTTCSLTAMGTVAAATAANDYSTYAGIGISINQAPASGSGSPPSLTVTPAGSGLTITFAASTGGLPLRAQLYDGTTSWCYSITGASPVTIPYSSFNTKCYNAPVNGTAYAKNPITSFQLAVFGAQAAGVYSIALVGLTENN